MTPSFTGIVVDVAKLRDYVLSAHHPRGRHKARVFRSKLALTVSDSDWLRETLVSAAHTGLDHFELIDADEFGRRLRLDFPVTTPTASAMIRSIWIVRTGEDLIRFVTCWVL